jgi:anti-sigma-K factor RskA
MTTASDLHTLTGAYAADALPELERRAFEHHLQTCETCASEVRGLQATAARLAAAAAETPPPGMRARVLAQVATTRQLPPPSSGRDAVAGARRSWTRQVLPVAAAVLLAVSVGLGGVVAGQRDQISDADRRAAQVARIASDPDRLVSTVDVAGGRGTVIAAGTQAVFLASDLPDLGDERDYQLWVVDAQGPSSVGVLDVRDGAVQELVPQVAQGEVVAVSIEPAGGSATPTTIVAQLPLEG